MCEGRVVIVTGAGNGIGRHHALEFARQGATVVVNDRGVRRDGSGGSGTPADEVVAEIAAMGGQAVADHGDVSDVAAAEEMVATAIDRFGRLDVLVNNAGILRDRTLVNMAEEEWDDVLRVHLKGTFAPSRAAARHWRRRAKAGERVAGRLVNTSSSSGLLGNIGQSNYGAAKAGIAGFTIVAAMELAPYGVTVNAVAPGARTRMTEGLMAEADGDLDPYDPAAISPLVAWLGSERSAGVTGQVFDARGGTIGVYEGWRVGPTATLPRLWRAEEVDGEVRKLLAQAVRNPRLPEAAG
ncbi:short-chain dehydrogenase [Sphaerisporangium rufum]|uniref:Short-chain dehydrogenase n=1 Tax=Sphaerisporangium rufum TaxID=1381558 RepID=A0A919R2L4_9ACTN|nr:short-chain dehydrogenase [Sphaerisporangium rufum]